MIQFASTDVGGCMFHNAEWSNSLVGICPAWDGRDLKLWVVGPSRSPELVDEDGQPLRPGAAEQATEEAVGMAGFPQCKGTNPIWILPLAEDLQDEAWLPFKLRVDGEIFAGMARRPPPPQRGQMPVEPAPKPTRPRLKKARK